MSTKCTCPPHWDGPQGDCPSCLEERREDAELDCALLEAAREAANWSPGDDEPDDYADLCEFVDTDPDDDFMGDYYADDDGDEDYDDYHNAADLGEY